MRFYLNLFQKNHSVDCLTYEQNTKKPYKDNLSLQRTCSPLAWKRETRKETSTFFNLFLFNSRNSDPPKFQGVCMDDSPSVEDIVGINFFIYDNDLIDGAMVGELARRNIKKYGNNVQLIRYKSYICYVDIIHAPFGAFRCSTCDTYFQTIGNLERHLVRCSQGMKRINPENVYQLPGTLFDKLDSFDIQNTGDTKLFEKLAVFDFDYVCIPGKKSKTPKRQIGLVNMFPYQSRYLQI